MNFVNIPSKLFAALMILIGCADLTRPESFRLAMDSINMPHYILWILGICKIAGGASILFIPISKLKEWAFCGFFIWGVGGIACHLLSRHGLSEIAPILGLTLFLSIAYWSYE